MDERDFVAITNEIGGPYCGLYDSPDGLRIRPPSIGETAAASWTPLAFRMDDSVPGTVVPDFIDNAFSYLMVSRRAKELFAASLKEPIEYLPFHILDHHGERLPQECYVVNVLGSLDCTDPARTRGVEDPLNPPLLDYIDELHLDTSRIPEGRRIFRLGIRPQVIVIHQSVADEITAAGFTGARFLPMGGAVE